jgi:hypothetical protein
MARSSGSGFRAETAVERRIYRALALLAVMRAQGPGNLLSAAGFNRFSYINNAWQAIDRFQIMSPSVGCPQHYH